LSKIFLHKQGAPLAKKVSKASTTDTVTAKLDSLPLRFKAGSKMVASGGFHHRSTTKKDNKTFKSRKATKGALKEQLKGMGCLQKLMTSNFKILT
jgi:hypothetical protein